MLGSSRVLVTLPVPLYLLLVNRGGVRSLMFPLHVPILAT
jgi:hypothetical protein